MNITNVNSYVWRDSKKVYYYFVVFLKQFQIILDWRSLFCLFFFDIQILITQMVSSNSSYLKAHLRIHLQSACVLQTNFDSPVMKVYLPQHDVIIIKSKVILPHAYLVLPILAILFRLFCVLVFKDFRIIWLSNTSILNVPCGSYSRNVSTALKSISTFSYKLYI